jgi:hypothetical protein
MQTDERPPPSEVKETWMTNPYHAVSLHAVFAAVLLVGGIAFTEWVNPDSGRPSNQEISDRFKTGDWTTTDRKVLHQEAVAPADSNQASPLAKDGVQTILDRLDKMDARLQQVEANMKQLDGRLQRVEANTRKSAAPNPRIP